MINKIIDEVKNLEDRMCEFAEINSLMFTHNKIYLIASKSVYNVPEYSKQPYTFKYGDYALSEYLKQYI